VVRFDRQGIARVAQAIDGDRLGERTVHAFDVELAGQRARGARQRPAQYGLAVAHPVESDDDGADQRQEAKRPAQQQAARHRNATATEKCTRKLRVASP
jgi:hypothetical protein